MAPAVFGTVLPDYLAHWTGGALLLDGHGTDLYSIERQMGFQESINGTSSVVSWFVSPPLVAALYVPSALVEYPASAGVWLVINVILLAACLWSLRLVAPMLIARRRGLVVLVLCASAPAFELLGGGQDSAFVLAVWLLALRLIAGRHQFVAGAALGLALLKPQHVVLVPLALLVTRRFGALSGFLVMGLLQAGLSLALVGPVGIARWVDAITGSGFGEQVQQDQAWKMVSFPAFLHAVLPASAPSPIGSILSIVVLVAAAIVLVRQLMRRRRLFSQPFAAGEEGHARGRDGMLVLIATLSTTVVFSPHLVVYDAVLFFPVALCLLENRPTVAVRLSLAAAFCTTWLAPAFHLTAGQLVWPFSIGAAPWTAIPLVILWIESLRLLAQRVRKDARPERTVA
ncbi:glycosyltransferase family 87 protein [Arthrobacter burdickii]|uniref:Glycosyltransferase family 87 protein n=1 Tax=Arthrobacter burdickii TaxID=3035920 RepID=A0ABT8K032_9MICC|nr:glycosyltransferase family 87 protein [Arthrobacter burdickii]MDN4610770.1 glycosyltransferase family 87 protein [Arthrobacter burdickii]